MIKEYPEDIQRLLAQVVDIFDKEDVEARDRQLRIWKQLKLAWDGFQKTWYSEVAHDWRIADDVANESGEGEQSHYDKPVNVFRAYLESIIAALSITVPPIKCFPDDADNDLDVSTARAGDKIGQLIYRHNDAPLLWLHALFIFCTEGLTCAYAYPKEDEKNGTYTKKHFKSETTLQRLCTECNKQIPDAAFATHVPELPQINELGAVVPPVGVQCPECGAPNDPNIAPQEVTEDVLDKLEVKNKSRVCIEVYGGLYVKVPNYAMKQADCPYLIFSYETHYTNALERYEFLRGKITGGSSATDEYGRWARLSSQYHGQTPNDTVTVRNAWLRPSAFNVLNKEDAAKLKKEFPTGARVVIVQEQFAEAEEEKLDDYWTLSNNPLSDYLHHDPLGLSLTPIQDITNDLISMILQTVEHGIGQTFADPGVLNFDKYRQTEVLPGGIYPVTPRTGKSVGDAFFELRTATLSQEVLPFFEKVQELGQIVSGATPSLFGGSIEGSKTASEYSMSRAQALQRLQNLWKIYTIWWKTIYSKAIPLHIAEMQEDDRTVEKDKQGNFVNCLIRKAEVEGKLGRVELEANENLPLTWSQRKDVITEMMGLNNPEILASLGAPENLDILKDAIGLTDFNVPGADDRDKQFEEIAILIQSGPIQVPTDPMEMEQAALMGQVIPPMKEESSVPIEPDVDNHQIESQVCRAYLVSEVGRQLKKDNPEGYKNILLHMQAHMQLLAQLQMQQQQATMAAAGPQPSKPEGSASPLTEKDNVSTAQ